MNRIKLPGKERNKKILLLVLIIIAIVILVYEGTINVKNKKIENRDTIIVEEEKNIKQDSVQEEDSNLKDISNNVDKEVKGLNNEKNLSSKENELYDEAYKLFFSKEYKSSIVKADELLREFPNSCIGYNIRGIAESYNGSYDQGMKDIDKSLELNENYGYAKFNKALCYELYGKMDDALTWYNKALEDEEYVWSYYGIASIYGRRGDVSNTMKYLNKAISMDKSVKDIAKNEADFKLVRNSEEFKTAVNN